MSPPRIMESEPETFWSHVDFSGDCWEWSAGRHVTGYGKTRFRIHGQTHRYPHRIAWFLLVGEMPVELDHLCRNRACVNPDHLQSVTRRENMLRGMSPAAVQHHATHCRNGHEYTTGNTFWFKGRYGYPRRVCVTCHREYWRQYRNRKKEKISG